MPQILEPIPEADTRHPNHWRFSRAQCEFLREAGVITGRYELIDGEVISKMGQNPAHAAGVLRLSRWLMGVFGISEVRSQMTVEVGSADPDYNSPEPDLSVTRLPLEAYDDRHPGPEDLLLLAEVSDTTARFDRTIKASLYARAGIQDYWQLDLNSRSLLVHRQPGPAGYGELTAYGEEESVATLTRPEVHVRVGDLLA